MSNNADRDDESGDDSSAGSGDEGEMELVTPIEIPAQPAFLDSNTTAPIPFNVEKDCAFLLLEARTILRAIMEHRLRQERIASGNLTVDEIQNLLRSQKEDNDKDWITRMSPPTFSLCHTFPACIIANLRAPQKFRSWRGSLLLRWDEITAWRVTCKSWTRRLPFSSKTEVTSRRYLQRARKRRRVTTSPPSSSLNKRKSCTKISSISSKQSPNTLPTCFICALPMKWANFWTPSFSLYSVMLIRLVRSTWFSVYSRFIPSYLLLPSLTRL